MNTEGSEKKVTLYVVATPIGNLEDITLRALRILKECDRILCEDTRMTKKLLSHYDIHVPTSSFHSHSSEASIEKTLELFREGKSCALVTDAGTPGISDPGSLLVAKVRAELPDVLVVPIPGPSAVIAALSASGIPSSDFLFLGFLPHKKGRETLFKEIGASERPVVFYESPHRVEKALISLVAHAPAKKVVIMREITKIFEQCVSGTPEEVSAYFAAHQDKVRGEFVIIVA